MTTTLLRHAGWFLFMLHITLAVVTFSLLLLFVCVSHTGPKGIASSGATGSESPAEAARN